MRCCETEQSGINTKGRIQRMAGSAPGTCVLTHTRLPKPRNDGDAYLIPPTSLQMFSTVDANGDIAALDTKRQGHDAGESAGESKKHACTANLVQAFCTSLAVDLLPLTGEF
jgi:hypothetical protein